nr:MAG TPA: Receptor Binding Protein [Caudoviricetes sp.]
MSFASGFFNSVDHDRLYDATDISRLFDGLIRDGIFASIGDCMVVKQSNQMNVTVGTGRAWFNHTWSYNDALYPVTIPPSEILMDRIDAIVLEINSVEAVRANSIKLIKGTPASTPTKPSLTNTKEVHQYPLAYVTVGKEVTSIRQADIENCVGTSVCPFVTGILEVISIEQLIPQWKDILNRFVEENTANFNTWMNGEKQEYQDWLTAAKKEITDWEATSKSDYQKWYDSIKNGYDQWFATIKAAYDANWSTFQQWEKASQTEFDKWFENMKNKLEGDLGAKLTLETEKLGKEKVSLIESTKTDLTGTVEAPLMVGKATRNLLPYPYAKASGSISHGVTMTYTKEGTVSLDGTISGSNIQPGFVLYENVEKLFTDTINTLYSKYDTTIKGDLHVFFQIFKKNGGSWVTNVETLSKNDFDWANYKCNYVVQYHKTSGDIHGTVSNIRIVTNADDPFVPYSGYDIKTYGKNLLAYPYAQKTANNNGLTFTVLTEGRVKIEGTTEKSFLAFIISTDECNAFLLRMLKAGHDLKISAKKSVTNVEAYLQVFTNENVYVKNFSDILKHDAYDWSKHHVIIAIQHNNPASNVNATVSDIMVTLDDSDTESFTSYQSSTTKITKDTEFPNFDLKSFDGVTHMISPGNVQSFHADAPNGKYLLESIKKSAESGGISYGADEPTNPKPGDLWIDTSRSDVLQYYTVEGWNPVGSSAYIASTGGFPSHPYVGQLCYNPNTKRMYVYIPFGGAWGDPGWLAVGSEDPGGYHYGASAPTNTKLLWIDTSGVAKFYNGSAWVPLAATWG